MRRITLWMLGTITTLVLLFSYHTSTSSGGAAASTVAQAAVTSGGSGSSDSSSAKTYEGDTVMTQWGPVQVQLTVAGGRITAAGVLQAPSGNHRDEEINSYAVPILNQEVVAAQNADIDMVSGATVTSDGYLQSLQSALDKAGL